MMNMLITDKKELRRYATDQRIWQGIPSIEVTKKGRIFVTFYAGGIMEHIGNYCMLVESRDGFQYSEPIAATYLADHRCYDPCLWIDPLGRLWFTWAVCPDDGLWGVICDDPDADELVWSKEFFIGHDIMMNKPVVLSTGEWLFPLAVWNHGVRSLPPKYDSKTPEKGSFVYKTNDNGVTFSRLGGADVPNRSFDEHMVVELTDGRLMMLVRTYYGIGVSYSSDRGRTWSRGEDSGLGGPSSRFHICRLRSGRLLLINHVDFNKRNNLMLLLSEDDGRTWPWRLMLDARDAVSYPDAKEAEDGYIYITHDRERGCKKKSLQQAQSYAREILVSRVTEEDILQGELVNQGSYLGRIASKLGKYRGEDPNPFGDPHLFSDKEYAAHLLKTESGEARVNRIFEHYSPRCDEQHQADVDRVDQLIARLAEREYADPVLLLAVVTAIRELSGTCEPKHPTVERITAWVDQRLTDELSLADMAAHFRMSRYYLCHLFKEKTGITILEYRNERRLTLAKQKLIAGEEKVTDIALSCGFGSASYFNEIFSKSEGMTPSAYRKLHSK